LTSCSSAIDGIPSLLVARRRLPNGAALFLRGRYNGNLEMVAGADAACFRDTSVMSLLDEIVRESSDGNSKVAGLLRKLKVVAARLKIYRLESWVESELSGYDREAELPAYRGPFASEVMGHFLLPFQSQTVALGIGSSSFDEDVRAPHLFETDFREPVSSLQDMYEKADPDHQLSQPWSDDVVRMANGLMKLGKLHLYTDAWLVNAWRPISPGQLASVLDAVRNRVLDVALEIEKLNPSAGEPGEALSVGALNIINNFIGGSPNVAQGSSVAMKVYVASGDLEALLEAIRAEGVDGSHVEALRTAIVEDQAEGQPGPGRRVLTWLANAATQTGAAGAGGILTSLILSYFGIS